MVGYSDSAKDGGFLAAQWAIHEALVRTRRGRRGERASSSTVFHGRGGTTGRGGGPTLPRDPGAAPAPRRPARLRITEQGETIAFKYGLPGLARRNLEQALAATLLASFPEVASTKAPERRRATLMGELADSLAARPTTRSSTTTRRSPRSSTRFTPIDELALLEIGSRPAAAAWRGR